MVIVMNSQSHFSNEATVLVPTATLVAAAQTALIAVERIRASNLRRLVNERLEAARVRNSHWYAHGPLRLVDDPAAIAERLVKANPFDDDTWLMADMGLRATEISARRAMALAGRSGETSEVPDGDWAMLDVYRPAGISSLYRSKKSLSMRSLHAV